MGTSLHDVIDPETDSVDVVGGIPKFAEDMGTLPTLPGEILAVAPGEPPVDKWMERFDQKKDEIEKLIKELVDERVKLLKQKKDIEERLAHENMGNEKRKKLEEEVKRIEERIKAIDAKIAEYNKAKELIDRIRAKINQLPPKALSYALKKIGEMIKIPPEYQVWKTMFDGALKPFIEQSVSLPGADPGAIVDWLKKNTVDPIVDLATATFKPPLKMMQELVDYINATVDHIKNTPWSFKFWEDMPPEMLKTDTVKDMVPEPLQADVEDIIKTAEEADEMLD